METTVIERQAVRALLLTPNDEVLLMRIRPPEGRACFWIAPGGGLETGETVEDGLIRELREELGLSDFAVGPVVWRRQHTFNWGGERFCQREQYRVVHTERFTPVMTDEVEAQSLDHFRWWRTADLPHSLERLTPLSLAAIIGQYLLHGPPLEAPPVEVLVD